MDIWLLGWIIFSFLEAGHTGPKVLQIPSHQIIDMGQMVTLNCDPVSNHLYFYWYKQILGQQMEFLVNFYNGKVMEKSKLFKDQFSVERPDGSYFTLKIQPTALEDSAVYFCASSLATALKKHRLPVHKLLCVCLFPNTLSSPGEGGLHEYVFFSCSCVLNR
uniref:Ig-like domain-containing protein n=2 Tax=Mus TaxID=862507 RepID=A0A8C6MQ41_MUSSI